MAGYNIAGNMRRVSPVQDILRTRAAGDTHKLNQLSIERAEIQMPYVEQLTQQQVRGNELDIRKAEITNKAAETELPYLERNLQQREEATDLQIDIASESAKKMARDREFQEAISSEKYTQEQLETMFPERWSNHTIKQMQLQTAAIDKVKSHLGVIRSSGNPAAMVDAYNRVISGLPKDQQGTYPKFTAENIEAGLAEMEHNMDTTSNSTFSQIADDYERYKLSGNDDLAAVALKNLEALAARGSLSGTQAERAANELFSWAPSPRAAYERWTDLKRKISVARETFVKRGIGLKPTDEMWGQVSLYTLQDTNPEAVAGLLQEFDSVAHAGLGKDDLAWYSEAQSRINSMTTIPGSEATDTERPSQYEHPSGTSASGEDLPIISNKQGWEAIKSGDYYITEDGGERRRKP